MRTWVAALACLLGAGCVSINVQRIDDTVRPARDPGTVAVLSDAPDRPYTVIALIESKSGAVFDSFDDLRKEMRAEAARLGGEAVILFPEETDESFILTGTAMIRSEERSVRCEVIVYDGRLGS
ncbi:MAG: hypothetical protein P8170_24605 [Gemmatimonadota bacterium]